MPSLTKVTWAKRNARDAKKIKKRHKKIRRALKKKATKK